MGENIVNIYGNLSLIYIYIYIFFFFEGEKNKSDNQIHSFWMGEKKKREEGFWHFLVAK